MNNLVFNKWLLIMMSLFAVTSFVSVAGANIFLGISTLLFLVMCYKNREISISQDISLHIKAIGAFALVLLISALLSGDIANGIKIWSDYFVWRFMPFIVVCSLLTRNERANTLLCAVGFGYIIDSLYVIYEGVFTYKFNISYGGAAGLAGHSMTFAGWSCVILPILFALIFHKDISIKIRMVFMILFVIGCIACFFNATRGAWLALAFVILIESIFFISTNKKSILILGCFITVIGIGLAQNQFFINRASSINDMKNVSNLSRLVMWKTAYDIFKKQPILGTGLGQYKIVYQNEYMNPKLEEKKAFFRNLPGFNQLNGYEQELILSSKANIWEIQALKKLKQIDRRKIRNEYLKQSDINDYENFAFLNHIARLNHAHSNIFQMLAENGLVGLFGYIFAFGFILWRNIKNYLLNKNPYALMITASTAALVLQGLTEYNFGNGAVMKIYWLILACLIVLVKAYNEEKLRE